MSTNYHNSDALLEENNRIESARIESETRANNQRHERFMRTLGSITRTTTIVGGLAVASIFGGPYALQGCQHVSDNWEISSARNAIEAKAAKAAKAISDAEEAAAKAAPQIRRTAAWENAVKTLGAESVEDIENRMLLSLWGDDDYLQTVGERVRKVLRDRGVLAK